MMEHRDLELVAAYLGTPPEELVRELQRGGTLETFAERYGRPRVGLEELVAKSLAESSPHR